MSDITLVWDVDNSRGDWVIQGAALATGGDLYSAVLISIFTDRQARTDDVIPDGKDDPRGWWGDEGEDYPIGSRLWLLERAKQEPETLARAKDYVIEGLKWMTDDGVVASFDVAVEWVRDSFMGIQIVAYQPSGANVDMTFAWAWKGN